MQPTQYMDMHLSFFFPSFFYAPTSWAVYEIFYLIGLCVAMVQHMLSPTEHQHTTPCPILPL
jgi:hypothetical protein